MKRLLLLASLTACGWVPNSTPTPGAIELPHPDDYTEVGHGEDAIASSEACASCHAAEGTSPSSSAPSCASCHEAYPHSDAFRARGVHGPTYEADPSACTDCHGTTGDGLHASAPQGQCVTCHATYPHGDDWRQSSHHGQATVQRGGLDNCANCHNVEPSGPCASCHEAYPHLPNYATPGLHGGAYTSSPDTCYTGCHNQPPGQLIPSCSSCHNLYPHPDGWTQGHIAPAQAQGEAACLTCHAPEGPELPVSCGASCHEGAP